MSRTPALLLVAVAFVACDRNLEPYDPDAEPSRPDLSKIFPVANEPDEADAANAPMMPEPPGGLAPDRAGGPPIRGTVRLAGGLGAEAPAGSVLFVIARRAGAAGGPPLAVRRIPAPELPLEFEIGPEHVMVPSFRFEGEIDLTARLDTDGNATTRLPGDVQGGAAGAVSPGAEGVEIVLDQPL